jgi:WD40 repeat protein
MIIIWESMCGNILNANTEDSQRLLNAFPIKNIYDPHEKTGAVACEFTPDSKYLVTLGAGDSFIILELKNQTVCLWDWTNPSVAPKIRIHVGAEFQVLQY